MLAILKPGLRESLKLPNIDYNCVRNGVNTLIHAASWGQIEVVRELLKIEPAASSSTTSGDPDSVLHHKAIHADFQTDAGGTSAMHCAVSTGALDIVVELVEYGVSLKLQNEYGQTPFMMACFSNSPEIVEYLCGGSCIGGRTSSPAAKFFHAEFDLGCSLKDAMEQTALHFALVRLTRKSASEAARRRMILRQFLFHMAEAFFRV